ncbi:M16 family metallopeptidase [Parapedobacter indicus]|uniref:Predicted Zn-dependent peptidase n=1 Tax=Parapedobacter indicus TaxID=1477437 RepID=A0A1I3DXS7_9SPHI|nr:pitrilysin family protein [Parapedobacter indicus]PPL04881.1 putative Zn-dependent peptidase [Parapedobacter indicus]SFH91409.1 Predicted Zn-dependent peptidase [Parapedobacter indicus]
MLDRVQHPPYHPVTGLDLIKPQEITFSNGLKVFVFDSGEQDLVRIEWIIGHLFSQENQALLNTGVCELLPEGTHTLSSAQIAELIDFHGAFLIPELGYDQSSLTLFSLNKHLEDLLPVIKDMLTNAIFPEKELATYVRNNKQKLQIALQKNNFVARRLFNKAIFGSIRYGYVPEMLDYDELTRDNLLSLFRQQYRPSNCTLVISGKITESVINRLEHLFGSNWVNQDDFACAERTPDVPTPEEMLTVDIREDSVQSAIRLGCLSIQRCHSDFPGLQVLNTVLGGYFGSRLMTNIREDKGYTYNISSGLVSLKHSAFFTIASEVGVDVTAATLREIEKEINKLRNEPMSEEELSVVRSYMMGSLLGSLENIFSHADKFKNVYFSGLGLDYYDHYTSVVNTITPDEICCMANTYLDYDKMIKVVVGKMETT